MFYLLPLKRWFALFQEGLYCFFVVLGLAGLFLGGVGQMQAFRQRHVQAPVYQVLD